MPVRGTPKRDRIQNGDGAIVPTLSVRCVQRSPATRNLEARRASVEDEVVTESFVLRCLTLRFALFLFLFLLSHIRLYDLCITRPPQIPRTRPHRRSCAYCCEFLSAFQAINGVESQTSTNILVCFFFLEGFVPS